MCRPLNDKVAELEAKYSSCMLCDLNERSHTIEGFDHDIDYLFKSFEANIQIGFDCMKYYLL